jgi:uncharacterized membrane protein YjfL (UPF0719 family)
MPGSRKTSNETLIKVGLTRGALTLGIYKGNSRKNEIKIDIMRALSWSMISLGGTVLIISTAFSSSLQATIGLSFMIWGIIMIYVRKEDYFKEKLLAATVMPSIETLNKVLKDHDYFGSAVYLPERYSGNAEVRVYISRQKNLGVPLPMRKKIRGEKGFVQRDETQGVLLTPPGADLARIFGEMLHTSFAQVGLPFLQKNLPILFVEELEIAEYFEMKTTGEKVYVIIGESTLVQMLNEKVGEFGKLGCPFSSAIACLLAKATDRAVILEESQTSDDKMIVNIEYSLTN